MKVKVKTLTSTLGEVDIESTDKILDVKSKIQRFVCEGMTAETQILLHAGRVLFDDKTVTDYGIKDNDLLVVMKNKQKASLQSTAAKEEAAKPTPQETATTTQPTEVKESEKSAEASLDAANTITTQPAGAVPDTSRSENIYDTAASEFREAQNFAETVDQIVALGFPRDDAIKALRAAFFNPDRAVEYLLNGIPEISPEPAVSETEAPQTEAPTARAQQGIPSNVQSAIGEGTLSQLRNHPAFEAMRTAVRRDPQCLPQVLEAINSQNPELARLIVQNQDEFLSMLSSDEGDTAPQGEGPATVQLNFTEEEMAAIQRLEALGFSRSAAAQAYIACDKNEELAANFLFDNIDELVRGDE